LDELSTFLHLFVIGLMFMAKLLFCCKKSSFVETLKEEHNFFFFSQSFTCPKFVNCRFEG
jgi:hypothetical protein